jgi:Domain of unknown function (DUF4272)
LERPKRCPREYPLRTPKAVATHRLEGVLQPFHRQRALPNARRVSLIPEASLHSALLWYGQGVLINAYATHRSPPAPDFPHQLLGRRDCTGAELGPHLNGFMGYVMAGGERAMTATRYSVLRHLERVRHHLWFEVDEAHTDTLTRWAVSANALLFTRDGAVRDPYGRVLVQPDTGEPEPGAAVPHPADALARKAASERALAERGIRVPAHLPPTVSAVEVELRDPRDVALRALALFACAVRAEGLAHEAPLAVETIRARTPLAFTALSPQERAFIDECEPTQQEVANHLWRYEALAQLAWALNLSDALPFPHAICDVPTLAKVMLAHPGDELVAGARLRPVSELLDTLDLTFRLHWAVTEARVNHGPDTGAHAGVVLERHVALNWLTRFEDAEWDEVDTPT